MWRRFVEEDIHLKNISSLRCFFFFVLLASDCKRELENASWERKKEKKSSGKRSNFELAVNHCPVVFFLPDSERLTHRGTRSFAGFLAWDHPYHRISKLNPTTQVDEVFLFLRGNWPTLKKRKKEKKREKKKSNLPPPSAFQPASSIVYHSYPEPRWVFSINREVYVCVCVHIPFFPPCHFS